MSKFHQINGYGAGQGLHVHSNLLSPSLMPTPEVRPRNRDAQKYRFAVVGKLPGLLPDASRDSVDQQHATICFHTVFFAVHDNAKRKPSSFGGTDHRRHLYKKPFRFMTTFKVGCSS